MRNWLDGYICTFMRFWQDLLDSLNSDGGHILLLAIMVWVGMIGVFYKLPKAEDLFFGAFTALMIILKEAGSNKTRRDRPTPESSTVVETTTSGPKPPEMKMGAVVEPTVDATPKTSKNKKP